MPPTFPVSLSYPCYFFLSLPPSSSPFLHLPFFLSYPVLTSPAVMFEFFSKDLYEATEAEAKRYDGLHLPVPGCKLLFIDPGIKDAIRDYVVGQQRQLRGM